MFNITEFSRKLFGGDEKESASIRDLSNLNKEIQSVQEEIFATDLNMLCTEIFAIKMNENNKLLNGQILSQNVRNGCIGQIIETVFQIENTVRDAIPSSLEIMLNSQNKFFHNYYHSTFQAKCDEELKSMKNYIKETNAFYWNIDIVRDCQRLMIEINELENNYKIKKERLSESSRSLELRFEKSKRQMNKAIIELVKTLQLEKDVRNIQNEIEKKKTICIKKKRDITSLNIDDSNSEEDEITFVTKLPILNINDFQSSLLKRIATNCDSIGENFKIKNVFEVAKTENEFKAPMEKRKKNGAKNNKISNNSNKNSVTNREHITKISNSPIMNNQLLKSSVEINVINVNSNTNIDSPQREITNGIKIVDCVVIESVSQISQNTSKAILGNKSAQQKENHTPKDAVQRSLSRSIPVKRQTDSQPVETTEFVLRKSTPSVKKKLKCRSPITFPPTPIKNYENLKRKSVEEIFSDGYRNQMKRFNSNTDCSNISKNNLPSPNSNSNNTTILEISCEKISPKENLKISKTQLLSCPNKSRDIKNSDVRSSSKSSQNSVNNLDIEYQFSEFLYETNNSKNSPNSKEADSLDFAYNFDFGEDKEKIEPTSIMDCDFFNLNQSSGNKENFDFNFDEPNSPNAEKILNFF